MTIITQRQLIQSVAKRWRRQYQPFKNDKPLFSWRTGVTSTPKTKQQIADELDSTDLDVASADDIYAIIGNDSWTTLKCHECDHDVTAIVQVGEEPDYESHTANLCIDCAKKAVDMFKPPGNGTNQNQ